MDPVKRDVGFVQKNIQSAEVVAKQSLHKAEISTKTADVGKLLGELNTTRAYLQSDISIKDFFQSVKAVILSGLGINNLTDRDKKTVAYAKQTLNVYQTAKKDPNYSVGANMHFEDMNRLIGDRSSRVHKELMNLELKENPVLGAIVHEFDKRSIDGKKMTFTDILKLKDYLKDNSGKPVTMNKLFEDMSGIKLSIKLPSFNKALTEKYTLAQQLHTKVLDGSISTRNFNKFESTMKDIKELEDTGNTELTFSPRLNNIVKDIEKESGVKLSLGQVVNLEKFIDSKSNKAGVSKLAVRDFVQNTLKINIPGDTYAQTTKNLAGYKQQLAEYETQVQGDNYNEASNAQNRIPEVKQEIAKLEAKLKEKI
jgi:hypothetical protein